MVRREEIFTLEELKRAGGRLKANTTPRIDEVPNEILKEVIGAYPEIFLEAFNSCFRKGRFFADWKKQKDGLPENQFGFRKGRSTVDVIQAVVNIATNARKGTGECEGFCALISIDMPSAFNTAG